MSHICSANAQYQARPDQAGDATEQTTTHLELDRCRLVEYDSLRKEGRSNLSEAQQSVYVLLIALQPAAEARHPLNCAACHAVCGILQSTPSALYGLDAQYSRDSRRIGL